MLTPRSMVSEDVNNNSEMKLLQSKLDHLEETLRKNAMESQMMKMQQSPPSMY